MRDRDGDELNPSRRASLLIVASLLIAGCATLSLALRAVPKAQLVTVTAAVLYVLAASFLQPAPPSAQARPDRIRPLALERQVSRFAIRVFLGLSFLISIVVPWVWIAGFGPSYRQLQLLGPHLFLMMAQVLFEIWSYRTTVSVVIRIGIPVGFVSYRMHLLLAWVQGALAVQSAAYSDWFMLVLASVNLCFWGVMLFYVLLLKICPPYFLESERMPKADMPMLT